MKTVGILTFHHVDNYGAVLQAYALRKKINSLGDYKAEIINYIPDKFQYVIYMETEESIGKLREKRLLFERFLREHCGITKPMLSVVEGNEYDTYCVGSDQVWYVQPTGENPNYFFGNLDEDADRISYAASVSMNLDMAYSHCDVFKKYITKFRSVSVREEEHVDFIKDVCGMDCRCVVDPTLLLGADDYEELVPKSRDTEEPFLFFFWLQHDEELMRGVEFANALSRKYNLNIIHSIPQAGPYVFNNDKGCMMYDGIEDFLWYIKNASIVVTNSYHATLFSFQFHTPFYIFVVEFMRTRIDTLAKKYGIEHRVVDRYIAPSQMNENIDWNRIDSCIETGRKQSMEYLEGALKSGKKG